MTMREKMRRAICPLVKPWMDGADAPKSECKCECIETPYGQGTPLCMSQMLAIVDAALDALTIPTEGMRIAADAVHFKMPTQEMSSREASICAANFNNTQLQLMTWDWMIRAAKEGK